MDMFTSTTQASSPPSPHLPPFSSTSFRDRGLFVTSSSTSSLSHRGLPEPKADHEEVHNHDYNLDPNDANEIDTLHQSPLDRVVLLTAKASSVRTLSTSLSQFLSDPGHYRLFTEMLHREIQKILSRSQVLGDGELSIYDMVLLNLMKHGKDLELDEHPAAVMWFVEEFLGTGGGGVEMSMADMGRQQRSLERSVTLSKVLSQGMP